MEENTRPTPSRPPQHPPHVLAKMEKRRQQKEKLKRLLPAAALVTVLVIALGIWIGSNSGKPDPTEPPDAWKTNILRSDEIPFDFYGKDAEYPVLGSGYQRRQISAVIFLDTLSGAPANAWDVSAAGNGSIMAWVEPTGDRYRLTIAGEGGICAGTSCRELFAGYENMTWISFGSNFHTDAVQDMSQMFDHCEYLASLDLSSFDTTAVKNMSSMFSSCNSLTSLDLSSFDTAAVEDMSWMFHYCDSLIDLNLRSFDTSAVQDMSLMFAFCKSLTYLDLSKKFVTTNANTVGMFDACPAREKYQYLLNN